ncbi:ankyrin repeat domain-containing protein [Pusillibacter faecalis]|uniref:ankyrin repeat domain-containing protein n=1 Tax=Pusillibacter faecalis TaxID=2714358 RepID=UPI00294393A9|nr:ankyrin repeat domain-containing protein [Pusillibacter faecalis]
MYKIGYIGRWESLPETAAAICDHDIPKLETMLQDGLDLNTPIQLSEYIKLMPLEIAVFQNDASMIHFLLEHGADPDLAEEQPLLLTAARCCGSEMVALFAGQAAKLSPKQKERAFQEVRWGKRPENISVLEEAGISVAKFGGEAFRAAVSDGQAELAKLLLEKGADINYHKPDMVFPYASTPVTEAARSNDFPMVRWLVEQGADITIVDKYGDRPYSVAVQNKNQEMADYLKALEPEDWHNEQEKVRQLKPYKLPARLVEYLKTGSLRLEFPEQELVKWAEFYSYMDVQEMTWKRKKLLSLMAGMDNYSDYLLLWSPRDKKLWYLDIEHEEFHPLAKWEDFIADPGWYLNGMIEGEFEE